MTKKAKYDFLDTGIRNALIANFNPPSLRNDIGQLWENFLIMERLKSQAYRAVPVNHSFRRTRQAQEIDLIEEREGRLFAYEFKWTGRGRAPVKFREAYPEAVFESVNRDNYQAFVGASKRWAALPDQHVPAKERFNYQTKNRVDILGVPGLEVPERDVHVSVVGHQDQGVTGLDLKLAAGAGE